MDYFVKAMSWTIAGGLVLLGILVGILTLRIIMEVLGFMLGSSVGTLILGYILYKWYKKNKDTISFKL